MAAVTEWIEVMGAAFETYSQAAEIKQANNSFAGDLQMEHHTCSLLQQHSWGSTTT